MKTPLAPSRGQVRGHHRSAVRRQVRRHRLDPALCAAAASLPDAVDQLVYIPCQDHAAPAAQVEAALHPQQVPPLRRVCGHQPRVRAAVRPAAHPAPGLRHAQGSDDVMHDITEQPPQCHAPTWNVWQRRRSVALPVAAGADREGAGVAAAVRLGGAAPPGAALAPAPQRLPVRPGGRRAAGGRERCKIARYYLAAAVAEPVARALRSAEGSADCQQRPAHVCGHPPARASKKNMSELAESSPSTRVSAPALACRKTYRRLAPRRWRGLPAAGR